MNVRELIKELSDLPPDTIVEVERYTDYMKISTRSGCGGSGATSEAVVTVGSINAAHR